MLKYMFIFIFVVGMMGSSLVAFAGMGGNVTDCDVTIKCTCEGKLTGVTRVVSCPEIGDDDDFEPGDQPGTLEVNCLFQADADDDDDGLLCPRLPQCTWTNKSGCCHSWENSNCLVTLPVEVEVIGVIE
ncbi:MAG TPA: hypothetical protein VGA95_12060 [Thermodesulfobacteriota bacterium]